MGKITKAMKEVTQGARALEKVTHEVSEASKKAEQALQRTSKEAGGAAKSGKEAGGSPGKPPRDGASGPADSTGSSWRDKLSEKDRASYDRLKSAVNRASDRTADEFRDSMGPGQLNKGRQEPWLRSMFAGTNIEKAAARDSSVASDANIRHMGASQPGKSVPDFVIGDGHNVDVTGGSRSSIAGHMKRDYYTHSDQIITYPSIPEGKLKDIFK